MSWHLASLGSAWTHFAVSMVCRKGYCSMHPTLVAGEAAPRQLTGMGNTHPCPGEASARVGARVQGGGVQGYNGGIMWATSADQRQTGTYHCADVPI